MSAPEIKGGQSPPCCDVGISRTFAGYALEVEHPGTGETAVETFAALPAVIARAAELIQSGYIIGIWSPTSFEGH